MECHSPGWGSASRPHRPTPQHSRHIPKQLCACTQFVVCVRVADIRFVDEYCTTVQCTMGYVSRVGKFLPVGVTALQVQACIELLRQIASLCIGVKITGGLRSTSHYSPVPTSSTNGCPNSYDPMPLLWKLEWCCQPLL